ncbi:MAG: zf-HC2 domain-containing protein [Candidatus Riflebacteria bacterium]|nr:zf-HC2 domain-containing protein [Candidatus Riflebacteria bacterium]
MKKCPEKEILMAYVDGELENDERAKLRVHLEKCSKCAKEVAAISEDSLIIKTGIDELFARHRVNDKIMAEIQKSRVPVATTKDNEVVNPWWQRLLWPALGLALLFLAIVMLIPSGHRYHGSAVSVSFHALNDDSTIDGVVVPSDQVFKLQACSRQALCGNFLFSTVAENPTEFIMKGTAMVSFADQAIVDFDKAEVELDLVNGSGVNVRVNNSLVSLTSGSVNYRSFSPPVEAVIGAVKTIIATETIIDEAIDLASSTNVASVTVVISADQPKTVVSVATATSEPVHSTETQIKTATVVAVETVASESAEQEHPASGVEHIFNPFTDKPLGQGQ